MGRGVRGALKPCWTLTSDPCNVNPLPAVNFSKFVQVLQS